MKSLTTPTLPCMCANVRRAARALTQLYDEALRPLGLTITQFTILQALSFTGEVTQGKLGEILAMDSTSLTRTLEVMNAHGWIEKNYGTDRRERLLRLSRVGKSELNRAVPRWRSTQEAMRVRLGKQRWDDLTKLINDTTSMIAGTMSAEEGDLDGATV
ncbi:MAG: MarR family winged helix-turn-helix transcriptional regulator [Acidobacteriaceae bacterium]